jgi:hypothetical protein
MVTTLPVTDPLWPVWLLIFISIVCSCQIAAAGTQCELTVWDSTLNKNGRPSQSPPGSSVVAGGQFLLSGSVS